MTSKNQQKRDLGLLILLSKIGSSEVTYSTLTNLFSRREIKHLLDEDFLVTETILGLKRFRVNNA